MPEMAMITKVDAMFTIVMEPARYWEMVSSGRLGDSKQRRLTQSSMSGRSNLKDRPCCARQFRDAGHYLPHKRKMTS
eukprot:5136557-Amphidinium_carterae.1